jgi:hypothetical protein
MVALTVDFKAMKTWLKNQDPNAIVGETCSACNCPVVNFLNSIKPDDVARYVIDGRSVYTYNLISKNPHIEVLNTETQNYIHRIDHLAGDNIYSSVTAAQALAVLYHD